ncbi:MAG: hypothetical protein EZS28_002348 [Streblomastix strix]|uniref:TRIP4/RQT4 C2HC5-type zinc finger domain-containing protein n=2 Tax=Streblomastix strix TaxID=222440 RepID=A0A5J4X4H5_9EUKA|nr:MAG: hypothetical protein EZS28_002348 [Streblomastix strix]
MALEFCTKELCRILGFDDVSDIAKNLISIGDSQQLKKEIFSLLGESTQSKSFLDQLLQKLGLSQSQKNSKPKQGNQPIQGPNIDLSKLQQIHKPSLPPDHQSQSQPPKWNQKQDETKKQIKIGGGVTIHGINQEIIIPRRVRCECQARRHPLINNCLKCGRIICTQEGAGPCMFCGEDVKPFSGYEEYQAQFYSMISKQNIENKIQKEKETKVLKQQNTEKDKLKDTNPNVQSNSELETWLIKNKQKGTMVIGQDQDGDGERGWAEKEEKGGVKQINEKDKQQSEENIKNQGVDQRKEFSQAIDYRNRLIQYDQEHNERAKIIDDQSDYFEFEHNIWNTKSERTAYKEQRLQEEKILKEKEREKKERRRIAFDPQTRTVKFVEENQQTAFGNSNLSSYKSFSQENDDIFPVEIYAMRRVRDDDDD